MDVYSNTATPRYSDTGNHWCCACRSTSSRILPLELTDRLHRSMEERIASREGVDRGLIMGRNGKQWHNYRRGRVRVPIDSFCHPFLSPGIFWPAIRTRSLFVVWRVGDWLDFSRSERHVLFTKLLFLNNSLINNDRRLNLRKVTQDVDLHENICQSQGQILSARCFLVEIVINCWN